VTGQLEMLNRRRLQLQTDLELRFMEPRQDAKVNIQTPRTLCEIGGGSVNFKLDGVQGPPAQPETVS
jgi:hypothetical protein